MSISSSLVKDGIAQLRNLPQKNTVTSIALVVLALTLYYSGSSRNSGSIRRLGGFPVLTAWTFFNKRYDFIRSNFKSDPHFKFKVLQHNVVAIRGEAARKVFFDTKSLDSIEGHKILMGAAPRISEVSIPTDQEEDVSWFNKQIAVLLNKSRLQDALQALLDDINTKMILWGKTSRVDPFKNVYDLVFQMTVRMATCDELASDLKAVKEIQSLYWTLEKSSTPTSLVLPWFPSPAKKRKEAATKELYVKLYTYVEMRRNAKVPSSDAMDVLIGQGLDTNNIVQCILGIIFAGLINTGINSCWALVFLASHPEWKKKVKTEISHLISKHTDTLSTNPLHKRLATIPVSAWEDELPTLELIIRETLRIVVTGTTLRRNLTDEMSIGNGGIVAKGDFIAYSLADVHLNPEIYSDPFKFDPTRYLPGREEDKKGIFSYLGWGAGRHPCSGIKVAKFEIKILMAIMLVGYELDVVDEAGKHLTKLPEPDRNDLHQVNFKIQVYYCSVLAVLTFGRL